MKILRLEDVKSILHGKSLDTEEDYAYVCSLLDEAAFEGEDNTTYTVTSVLSFYDTEEIYPDCTVQVLSNSKTGDVSVGWWRNDKREEYEDGEEKC